MVVLDSLSIDYPSPQGRVQALRGISARFERGSVNAIIGPSGCGKTSLIQAIAGLRPLSSGSIEIDGSPLAGIRGKTAVIFQDYGLLPWKTVRNNAELPLRLRGLPKVERGRKVTPILEELGLAGFARLYPARLSGGMKQRLAVARALASDPDLLLMDEPFSSLDALTRENLQEILLQVQRRHGTTIVIVTHSIEEAVYLADTVNVMTGRNPGQLTARIETGRRDAPEGGFRSTAAFLELTTLVRRKLEAVS